jgi:hypothetical protein
MAEHAAPGGYWEEKGAGLLWFALLAGPVAWALDELISYAAVKPVCFADARFTLTAINGGALVLVAAGALVAASCLSRLKESSGDGGRRVDRSYFMAIGALGLHALFALLIVFATIPQFVLSPCE